MAKFDLFTLEIDKLKPTFIIITEIHLKPEISDTLVSIHGYNIYRHDRIGGKGWGGVAIYVENYHNNVMIHAKQNNSLTKPDVEALWLNIQYGKLKLLLGGVYRPTHYTYQDTDRILFDIIEESLQESNVIIMGDFNLPNIQWPLTKLDGYDTLHQSLIDMYTRTNCCQLITDITRKRKDQESTLDLIICNNETLFTNIEYRANIGKSDHLILLTTAQYIQNADIYSKKIPRRNLFKADYDAIKRELNKVDLKQDYHNNTYIAWDVFKTTVKSAIEAHISLTSKHYKERLKPWINNELLDMVKLKCKLWKFYQLNRTDNSYKDYRKINNTLTKMIRKTKQKFEAKLIDSGPKAFYSHIRKQLSTKISVPPILRNDSNVQVTNCSEVANVFAQQLEKSFVREPRDLLPSIYQEYLTPWKI